MSTGRKINEEKLRDLIKERIFRKTKLTSLTDLSKELEYSRSFMSNSISNGKLSNNAVVSLEKIYGIKYEEYMPEEEKKLSDNKKISDMTPDEFSNLIYKSVYLAIKTVNDSN